MQRDNKNYFVKALTGVWKAKWSKIETLRRTSPIHWYNQRDRHFETDARHKTLLREFEPRLCEQENVWSIRGKNNNAACSYIFDCRQFDRVA
jgi:hypothetical protein